MTCGAWIREPRLFLFEIREGGSSPSWWRHVAGRPGPLRERGSPGETDGHKPAKYFHPRHFQWPAALPATAGNRLAAIPMLRCNWKNPATPQPRLSVSAIGPPAKHRREILESKSPHEHLQWASNGQQAVPKGSATPPGLRTRHSRFWDLVGSIPISPTSSGRLMPARTISLQRLYQYVGLRLSKTRPETQRTMSLPQGRRVTRVEPAGRKGRPVCRRYRRHRVHRSRSSGLRSGGALFRASGLRITSPRRGLRAESGRRNCPIPSPGRSRRLRSTCRCCHSRCHGNTGRNSPARPAHRSSG